MFLKMYNVNMLGLFAAREMGSRHEMLLEAPFPFQRTICSHAFKMAVTICCGKRRYFNREIAV